MEIKFPIGTDASGFIWQHDTKLFSVMLPGTSFLRFCLIRMSVCHHQRGEYPVLIQMLVSPLG